MIRIRAIFSSIFCSLRVCNKTKLLFFNFLLLNCKWVCNWLPNSNPFEFLPLMASTDTGIALYSPLLESVPVQYIHLLHPCILRFLWSQNNSLTHSFSSIFCSYCIFFLFYLTFTPLSEMSFILLLHAQILYAYIMQEPFQMATSPTRPP